MSVQKLNKVVGLLPEKETTEEHSGPSKTLQETIQVVGDTKTHLREIEHYIEKCEGSEQGIKKQLEEQLMKTKQDFSKLERMLKEAEAEPDTDIDVFGEE